MGETYAGFRLTTKKDDVIRFRYLSDHAPETIKAFHQQLPFSKTFYHARSSGQEIWTEHGPQIHCIQENASVFCEPGEVVIGPAPPSRTKTAGMMGIYYGEGKGIDAANVFAIVWDEDRKALAALGNEIWRQGEQLLTFEKI